MVIEYYKPGALNLVYERFYKQGRMLPEGLHYIDSWLENNGSRCFQLMAAGDFSLFEKWTEAWKDLVDFEIIEIGEKPEAGG